MSSEMLTRLTDILFDLRYYVVNQFDLLEFNLLVLDLLLGHPLQLGLAQLL